MLLQHEHAVNFCIDTTEERVLGICDLINPELRFNFVDTSTQDIIAEMRRNYGLIILDIDPPLFTPFAIRAYNLLSHRNNVLETFLDWLFRDSSRLHLWIGNRLDFDFSNGRIITCKPFLLWAPILPILMNHLVLQLHISVVNTG